MYANPHFGKDFHFITAKAHYQAVFDAIKPEMHLSDAFKEWFVKKIRKDSLNLVKVENQFNDNNATVGLYLQSEWK